jgi:hypothetical protein
MPTDVLLRLLALVMSSTTSTLFCQHFGPRYKFVFARDFLIIGVVLSLLFNYSQIFFV